MSLPLLGLILARTSTVSRLASDDEPFAALAFKVMVDPYVGTIGVRARVFWGIRGWIVRLQLVQRETRAYRAHCANACE